LAAGVGLFEEMTQVSAGRGSANRELVTDLGYGVACDKQFGDAGFGFGQ
jgi:hypothetical protein